MKTKNIKLEWNVLIHDFNSDKIIKHNIFDSYYIERIEKDVKKKLVYDHETLKELSKTIWMSRYWCRSEYEILVSGLFSKSQETKLDAWYQIEINLDRIIEYVNAQLQIY